MRLISIRTGDVLALGLSAAPLVMSAGGTRAASCEGSSNFSTFYKRNDTATAAKALPPEALIGKKGKPVKTPPTRRSASLRGLG